MANSKIFSFADTKEVREIDVPEWFVGDIADYYDDTLDEECKKNNRAGLLSELKSYSFTVNEAEESVEITEDSVRSYFQKRYEAFKNAADALSLDDFCDCYKEYELRVLLEDRHNWYIDSEFAGLLNIDSFMRECFSYLHSSDKKVIKFYLSDVVSYHF